MPDGDAPRLIAYPLAEVPWDPATVEDIVVILARAIAQKHHDAEEAARREAQAPCSG